MCRPAGAWVPGGKKKGGGAGPSPGRRGLGPGGGSSPRHDERKPRQPRSRLTRLLMALPAAVLSFLASSAPAFADLKPCNRMSYVVEAAIGIDDKAATATRGWFRIDPPACRVVMPGTRSEENPSELQSH